MSIVLMLIGLLATAAGFVTIGFGIPINAFSLGNTLIIAGTIAVAAGLILIGLAAMIGQLRRIAEGLNARPLTPASRSAESVEALVPPQVRVTPTPAPPPVSIRMPISSTRPLEVHETPIPGLRASEPDRFAARRPDLNQSELPHSMLRRPMLRQPMPSLAELRVPATAAGSELPGQLDWLRAKSKPESSKPESSKLESSKPEEPTPSATIASNEAEPPVVEVPDEAPLSPRPPLRPLLPPLDELVLESKIWTPDRSHSSTEPQPTPRSEPTTLRSEPASEQPKGKKAGFEMVWPDRTAAAPTSEPAKREAGFDMPLPPVPSRPGERRPAEKHTEISPKPASLRGPTILKSGVIDGMPYTLYADGSIEAKLPHGIVKFASVDALRAHLEKQS